MSMCTIFSMLERGFIENNDILFVQNNTSEDILELAHRYKNQQFCLSMNMHMICIGIFYSKYDGKRICNWS